MDLTTQTKNKRCLMIKKTPLFLGIGGFFSFFIFGVRKPQKQNHMVCFENLIHILWLTVVLLHGVYCISKQFEGE